MIFASNYQLILLPDQFSMFFAHILNVLSLMIFILLILIILQESPCLPSPFNRLPKEFQRATDAPVTISFEPSLGAHILDICIALVTVATFGTWCPSLSIFKENFMLKFLGLSCREISIKTIPTKSS